ncbi:hypothetical protein I7I50_04084 [Histoplasma capsulatum G186AR]|uniref:Uncharacterized protein n=1 Tax=Ajellomyces capsulatus TaxID=5037 RepID=A0A8H8CXQ8_AJECA|nr:hypothetical protein I7I52_04992 [Histoplasma capsulatum]QSS75066.1 hypothetical protein I7I50_04084 [Histoplasma capsulatum G186AR]
MKKGERISLSLRMEGLYLCLRSLFSAFFSLSAFVKSMCMGLLHFVIQLVFRMGSVYCEKTKIFSLFSFSVQMYRPHPFFWRSFQFGSRTCLVRHSVQQLLPLFCLPPGHHFFSFFQ